MVVVVSSKIISSFLSDQKILQHGGEKKELIPIVTYLAALGRECALCAVNVGEDFIVEDLKQPFSPTPLKAVSFIESFFAVSFLVS